MSDGVVGHVDGGIREGLDEVLGIPGHARAEAKGAGARPLAEPTEGVLESLARLLVVGHHALEALLGALAPGVLAVLEVPLVGERHHALVAGAGRDLLLGLRVYDGAAVGDHDVADLLLHELHGLTLVDTEEHDPVGEALEVGLTLGLLQLDLLVLALNLELLADDGRARVAKLRDVHARDNLERHHPLVLHAKLLAKRGLSLEVAERHEVHGRVRRDGRHHPGALVHQDGHHGETVNLLEHRERGLDRAADERGALETQQLVHHPGRLRVLLERQVASRAIAHHHDVAVGHLKRAVVAVGKRPAVGLPVHGLRPQRRRGEEDIFTRQRRQFAREAVDKTRVFSTV